MFYCIVLDTNDSETFVFIHVGLKLIEIPTYELDAVECNLMLKINSNS